MACTPEEVRVTCSQAEFVHAAGWVDLARGGLDHHVDYINLVDRQ